MMTDCYKCGSSYSRKYNFTNYICNKCFDDLILEVKSTNTEPQASMKVQWLKKEYIDLI